MSLGTQFGLLATGWVPKQEDDITADLQAALQAAYGASIDVSPTSRFGQAIGIITERYLELWNLATAVFESEDPDQAIGTALLALCALTGTAPVIPTPSVAVVTCTGTPTTILPLGRVASVTGTGSLFQSQAAGTITAVPAWATGTGYVQSSRTTANGKVWQLTNASGTSAGGGSGPSGNQGAIVTDNTCTWLCLGSGTGAVDVVFDSESTGAVVAANGAIVTIQTPVAGWSSCYNVSAAVLGIAAESAGALRQRRVAELHGPGRGTLGAIRAAVLAVSGVTNCTVFENTTDSTNGDGMPPHSIEVLAAGGTAAASALAIFNYKDAGIATTGNQSPQTVVDSQGTSHTILFSRPTAVPIYFVANVIIDPNVFPSNGVQLLINNLLGYGGLLPGGYNVVSSQFGAAMIAGVPSLALLPVPGLLDSELPLIGVAPAPGSSTTIVITSRQQATFSQGNISINTTPGSP